MGTVTLTNRNVVLSIPPEILGVGSEFEKQRISLKEEYEHIILEAKKITAIDSINDLEIANNLGRILQAGSKDAEAFFAPVKRQIDALKKPVLNYESEFTGALEGEKKRLAALITRWNLKCAEEQREKERQAREEAEAAARDEALARAVELEASGDLEQAEALLEEPIMAAPVVIQNQAPPKPAGQVSRMSYSATVVDLMALVKAVAEGKEKIQCLMANESYINATARNDKEGFSIAGCKLNRTPSTNFRS